MELESLQVLSQPRTLSLSLGLSLCALCHSALSLSLSLDRVLAYSLCRHVEYGGPVLYRSHCCCQFEIGKMTVFEKKEIGFPYLVHYLYSFLFILSLFLSPYLSFSLSPLISVSLSICLFVRSNIHFKALECKSWTFFHHLSIWGSILFW